jgi:hypothetical protein
MEQLGTHFKDFREIWYFNIFRKYVEKINVSLKSDKNNGYFTRRLTYIYECLAKFVLEWEIFQTKIVEKIKPHIFVFNNFFPENRAVCERMWKNMVEPDRPQMTI